ncbi:Threonine aldolase [Blastocladiella emersonii ATCC 22665]|nr:Threonine aldolase [Blastocladiella emersonii ATCC 22665]
MSYIRPGPAAPQPVAPQFSGPAAVAYDFRSDTVTVPTPAMFAAMAAAPVGDDVFVEDPSVNALESRVASLLGKPAGLFCTTGTLANQLAIRTHLAFGGGAPHSVLVDGRAHVHRWEAGGIAAHTGAAVVAVDVEGAYLRGERGANHLTADDVRAHAILGDGDPHGAPTRLVCVENTMNGAVLPLAHVQAIGDAASELGVPLHMDGARLWNAAVATGTPLATLAAPCHSVSVCLSKGVGAPVGSVLVGDAPFVARARHLRKMYGGGWRQAGVLAAAADVALTAAMDGGELAKSHVIARELADALVKVGLKVTNAPVETNMVFVDWSPLGWTADDVAKAVAAEAAVQGGKRAPIRISGGNVAVTRLVVHYQIAEDAVDRLVAVLEGLKKQKRGSSSSSSN